MKTTLSLLLLSVTATTGVYSIESPARPNLRSAAVETPTGEELNANLREAANIFVTGPSNLHQCLNHCERHTSKSQQWINDCEEDCYEQYGQPVCYNQGDSCKKDEVSRHSLRDSIHSSFCPDHAHLTTYCIDLLHSGLLDGGHERVQQVWSS